MKLLQVLILSVVGFLLLVGYLVPAVGLSLLSTAWSTMERMPILVFLLSAVLFGGICLANWHEEFRNRVNFYLSGGVEDPQSAYAAAEETLYLLNGILVPIALILGGVSLATFLGL
jgi:hypothetical protein